MKAKLPNIFQSILSDIVKIVVNSDSRKGLNNNTLNKTPLALVSLYSAFVLAYAGTKIPIKINPPAAIKYKPPLIIHITTKYLTGNKSLAGMISLVLSPAKKLPKQRRPNTIPSTPISLLFSFDSRIMNFIL